jgi:hypothetical protein
MVFVFQKQVSDSSSVGIKGVAEVADSIAAKLGKIKVAQPENTTAPIVMAPTGGRNKWESTGTGALYQTLNLLVDEEYTYEKIKGKIQASPDAVQAEKTALQNAYVQRGGKGKWEKVDLYGQGHTLRPGDRVCFDNECIGTVRMYAHM